MKSTGDLERKLILIGVLLATFLAAIEGTVTGPAGPAIVGEFQGMQWLSWIFTSYLLAMAITTPIFGKISDLFGRKPVFMWGQLFFIRLIIMRYFAKYGAADPVPGNTGDWRGCAHSNDLYHYRGYLQY